MSPLAHFSRPLRAAGAALLLAASVAVLAGPAPAAGVPAGTGAAATDPRDLDAALAQARGESDAAEAALDAAKRIATPGHLLDPLPARLMAGLGELQAEYAEMERKAAGYRATLGDQHPTLKGAEEVLAELRGQILDIARRAGATAQQDATRARAVVASLERQARATEATGSIAPPAPMPRPAARPAATAPAIDGAAAPAASPRTAPHDALAESQASSSIAGRSLAQRLAGALPLVLRHPGLAAVAGLLAGGAALGLLAALFRPRRPLAPAPIRIEPAAPADTLSALQPSRVWQEPPDVATMPSADAIPLLATLALRADDDPAAVLLRLARRSDAALERGAASVFATVAAAAGLGRIGVAVTSAAGAPGAQADAVALALARAAAGAGYRVLLVDGHADDRLGRALAGATAVAAIVVVDGRVRTVLRLTIGDQVVAVLVREAVVPASADGPVRLPNLDGFDAVVIAGDADSLGGVVPSLALMVAPHGAAAADLAVASGHAVGETGRSCGVLLVESAEDPTADVAEAVRLPEPAPPRRRALPEAATARLGLRRTLDPTRRRA